MKKQILAATAGFLGLAATGALVQEAKQPPKQDKQEQMPTTPPQEEKEFRLFGGGLMDYNRVYPTKSGQPFYASLQYKRTKWGKVTVKKIR
jgi:hypothetical protein